MLLAIAALLGTDIGFANESQVLDQVRKEIASLENGAGDVWDYSGSGGYIFRFTQDVLGDDSPDSFVNVSVRPNVWHVFTGNESRKYIGDVKMSGSGFLLRRDGQSTTLLDTYQVDALEKYVVEQKITSAGIQKSARKVGENATQEEYQAILSRQESDDTSWVNPKMEGILLYDLLNQSSPDWFDFNPDEAQVRNGYYRLPRDDGRIGEFQNIFTPKVALKALNQALGETQRSHQKMTAPHGGSAQSTPVPTVPALASVKQSSPQPTASPTPTAEIKSSPGFPFVPVAIVAAVIVGIVMLILRRKST